MVTKYAEGDFLDFLENALFQDVVDGSPFPEETPTFREIFDQMRNNDSFFSDTYHLWRKAYSDEFKKYMANPQSYVPPQ